MKVGDEIVGPVKGAWHLFIERTESLRPDLHKYCRSLTGSVWDGEDLVQDTLLRAFARLSEASEPINNLRSYIFKIASNLWIDKFRGLREFASADLPEAAQPEVTPPYEIRDAARQLLTHLPPMERATVLLKDVFDFSLEETASAVDSTVGAVKAALHRGRAKLNQMPEHVGKNEPKPSSSAALVEEFVNAFNERNLNRLLAVMREDVTSEMVGMFIEYGRESVGKSGRSVLHHTFASPDAWLAESRDFDGELIIVLWAKEGDGKAVKSIARLNERDGAVSRVRYYFFCPETLSEVCSKLGLPARTNGYRPTWN
jgi:RNA polymerase sigma-70 factor (ECF subfamily)